MPRAVWRRWIVAVSTCAATIFGAHDIGVVTINRATKISMTYLICLRILMDIIACERGRIVTVVTKTIINAEVPIAKLGIVTKTAPF